MTLKTLSSREFNQDLAGAKRAAREGPVIVTDRGEPAFVLLAYEDYRRLSGTPGRSLADLLYDPNSADIDFEPPRLTELSRPATFE